MKVHPWAAATAAFAAGTIAAVGISQATTAPTKIPDSTTGVITACMVKKTGAVRFINAQVGKTCTKKEKKISFNKTGPQGAAGAPGAAGAQGPVGPSNSYVKVRDTAKDIGEFVVVGGNTIVELTLPAGQYTFVASASAGATNGTTKSIKCSVSAPDGSVVKATQAVLSSTAPLPNGSYHPMTVNGTYTNTVEAKLTLACWPSDDIAFPSLTGDGRVLDATLTATKVGEVTVQ